jgi:hypothetical protein
MSKQTLGLKRKMDSDQGRIATDWIQQGFESPDGLPQSSLQAAILGSAERSELSR